MGKGSLYLIWVQGKNQKCHQRSQIPKGKLPPKARNPNQRDQVVKPRRRNGRKEVRDKLNNMVLFDKPTYDKLYKEVPTYKLITPSVVSERLKVRVSLARAALAELSKKGLIIKVVGHNAQQIFTRATNVEA